jgi:shikimate dehydrogenase
MSTHRLYGLIGYPLLHSASPAYFKEKFTREGITDSEYRLFPIENITELTTILALGVRGLNVTIPYKETVIPFLDSLHPSAAVVGAVNCIVISSSGLTTGYNTDVFGFEMSIKPFLENKYERALILGTGGAAKAVAHVLQKWNIDFRFLSRNPRLPNQLPANEFTREMLQHFPLIINCTPLGTQGSFDGLSPLSEDILAGLSDRHFVYDLVYNPPATPLLRMAADRGAHTMNGLSMLHLQADKSLHWWSHAH